jgi:molybdate transport system substrate-binding protein
LAFLLALTACSSGGKDTILVFGAASLKDVLEVQATYFTASRGLDREVIRFHFHSSNVCAAQIRQGAPADLFVSADDDVMIDLAHYGLLQPGGYHRVARNRLALIIPRDFPSPIQSLQDLSGSGWRRLALGNPESVPAGRYGKAALEAAGLWPAIEPYILRTEHVRQALFYVARGEAEAGLVYATDAELEPGVEIVELIEEDEDQPIIFSGGVIHGSGQVEMARSFLIYLISEEATTIWSRFGFIPLTAAERARGLPAN